MRTKVKGSKSDKILSENACDRTFVELVPLHFVALYVLPRDGLSNFYTNLVH